MARDGAKCFLRYDLVKMEGAPFSIDGAQTVMGITPNGKSTDVNWRSWPQSSVNFMIAPRRKKGYEDGIAHLAKCFNISLGKLDVTAVKGTNLPGGFLFRFYASSHANIEVDGQEPLIVKSEWCTSLRLDADPVEIDILQTDSKMSRVASRFRQTRWEFFRGCARELHEWSGADEGT